MTTRMPAAENTRAIPSPMPLAPPVMNATLPATSFMLGNRIGGNRRGSDAVRGHPQQHQREAAEQAPERQKIKARAVAMAGVIAPAGNVWRQRAQGRIDRDRKSRQRGKRRGAEV